MNLFARAFTCTVVAVSVLLPNPCFARWHTVLEYHQGAENTIVCPANFECSVALQRGEQYSDGYTSDVGNWDPRVIYVGDHDPQPYLIFQPSQSGKHANMVIATTKHAYYFSVVSTNDHEPHYYWMDFPDERHAAMSAARAAHRSQETNHLRAVAAVPDPSYCNDYHYMGGGPDVQWRPTTVCNDGRHTYLMLQNFHTTPNDLPILYTLGSDNQEHLANYTYDAVNARYVVDGVPNTIVLVTGTSGKKLTMRIDRQLPNALTPAPSPMPGHHHHHGKSA